MKEFNTEIDIEASPERVWQVFTDLSSYREWNPFIKEASGELSVGSELKMFLQPPGGRGMQFHPFVLTVIPNVQVTWRGHIPGVFTGEHTFKLEPLGENRTRFTQHSKFTGLAAKFVGNKFVTGGHQGFEAMEVALKKRVEATIDDQAGEVS